MSDDFMKFGQLSKASNEAQQEFSNFMQQIQEDVRTRVELEQKWFAELSGKLSTVKSLPNAMQAYQEWMTHHVEAMAKDSQKFMANSQKLMSSFTKWTPGSGSN